MTFFALKTTLTVNNNAVQLNACNPTICALHDGYVMNVRWINTGYNSAGDPTLKPDQYISSNSRLLLDSTLMPTGTQTHVGHLDGEPWSRGHQDVRLVNYEGKLFFLAGKAIKGKIQQVFGEYKTDGNDFLSHATHLKPTFRNPLGIAEKNWVFFPSPHGLRIIHSWFPLRLCEIKDTDRLAEFKVQRTPRAFRLFRGSSSSFTLGGRHAFVIHEVHERRFGFRNTKTKLIYTHRIVLLNDYHGSVWSYSESFKFSSRNIEFCTSAINCDEDIVLSGSLQDRECFLCKVPSTLLIKQLRWAKV